MTGALAACLIGLAMAGCNPVSDQYFREGAGVDLYSTQLAQSTQLQDEYVYYICRQAHTPSGDTSTDQPCTVTDWNAFTGAGMNDIERRCDAYLDWLDAQRRDRTPILSQIAAISGATGGIMGAAGASSQALSIVATAFGLASATYANWNSRLLLDVDHSTVQTIVYSRQQKFRQLNAGATIPDRPTAIYLLRGYLRICMPITIETDINTSVTVVQTGSPVSVLQNTLVRKAVFGGATGGAPAGNRGVSRASQPVTPASPVSTALPHAKTDPEKSLTAAQLGSLQADVLCAKKTGKFDNATRASIRIYQSAFGAPATGTISSATDLQNMLDDDRGVACPARARNRFELDTFFLNGVESPDQVKTLQHLLHVYLGTDDSSNTGMLDMVTRKQVQTARGRMKKDLKDVAAVPTQEVTPKFYCYLRQKAAGKPTDGC